MFYNVRIKYLLQVRDVRAGDLARRAVRAQQREHEPRHQPLRAHVPRPGDTAHVWLEYLGMYLGNTGVRAAEDE